MILIQLEPDDHNIIDNEFRSLFDRHNLLLIEFEVNYSFNDPTNWTTIEKTIKDYYEENGEDLDE